MKTRLVLVSLCVLLFSSCIVKSIQPFYTKSSINYSGKLVGNWTDNKNGQWDIRSFKDEWEKETDPNTTLSKESKEAFERFKDGYYIKYKKKDTEASFIAMPFMVNKHLFIDLTPFEYDSDDLNKLVAQHLLKTHSTAFVDITNEGFTLKWLSEKAVNKLITEKRLRIKHERTGIDEDLVLTASSDELHNFLKKFMVSDFEDKWDNDDIRRLKPNNAKP
ncbi:hypothetical protein DFQ05_0640 [Winogradskyella wandonensis]|uniref:Uncharacterized protein n=1 Tax=Winogradskyella wandonensis TaxID=1442586 RepID=A0A4R1KVC1_9FLAO|nr:hypothetical protein [Winogradskyella wandonensis]TCK69125.1 hypothetical protein DFQ05_0640 [Winogradskyella wandonensis]